MITFQTEKIAQVEADIKGLLPKHWEEVALDKDTIRLNPDWEAYRNLESLGMLHVFTARTEGVLVGYYISIIRQHLHYVASKTSISDIFYIAPYLRHGRTALRLFQEHERAMKELKVQKAYVTHKLHINDIGPLLVHLGYKHIENVYAKVIGD